MAECILDFRFSDLRFKIERLQLKIVNQNSKIDLVDKSQS